MPFSTESYLLVLHLSAPYEYTITFFSFRLTVDLDSNIVIFGVFFLFLSFFGHTTDFGHTKQPNVHEKNFFGMQTGWPLTICVMVNAFMDTNYGQFRTFDYLKILDKFWPYALWLSNSLESDLIDLIWMGKKYTQHLIEHVCDKLSARDFPHICVVFVDSTHIHTRKRTNYQPRILREEE